MNPGHPSAAPSDAGWGTTGLVSIALHVLVLAVATHSWLMQVRHMTPAGTPHGIQRMLLYMPGHASSSSESGRSAPLKLRPAARIRSAPLRVPAITQQASANPTSAKDVSVGNDIQGTRSVNIAWIQAFPAAKPDLSKLTIGAPVDVVIEVHIDDRGRVARATARKGMGHEIDEVFVATVEQWVFYPAMKNGRPIASEQELHFHYERGRGPEPCGWDCFKLASR